MDKKRRDQLTYEFVRLDLEADPIWALETINLLQTFFLFLDQLGCKIEMVFQGEDEARIYEILDNAEKEVKKAGAKLEQYARDIIGH